MTKKRYQLTLTQESVDRIHDCIRELGMHSGALSHMVDASLPTIASIFEDLLEKRRQGKTVTLNDFYGDMFSRMAELMKENQE